MTSISVFGADVSQANDKVFHGDKGKRFEGESKKPANRNKKSSQKGALVLFALKEYLFSFSSFLLSLS